MKKINPFLWFDSEAEEAAKFYVGIFKNSKIWKIARYGEEAAQKTGRPAGSVMATRIANVPFQQTTDLVEKLRVLAL